ncbi:MAG: ATP-binding protein [Desulfofustis sp.]|jgi:MinD superfamily P-loop ATPase
MKELVIISGKGGTGKTSLSAAFASLAENHLLCDTDVDAADLHLLLNPRINEQHDFIGGSKAQIELERCTGCGTCVDVCQFSAISSEFVVDPIECEGCGVCHALCPEKAIDFRARTCGEWFISSTRFGPMVHARLGIGEENSGKLVSLIRKQAQEIAQHDDIDLIITDGPPGIGCPVIASITGATAVLIVVEPTLSGLHDMQRVADLAAHFRIPAMVCINKYDLNNEMTALIEVETHKRQLMMVGRIPFDPAFTRSMVNAQTVTEYDPASVLSKTVNSIWRTIRASEFLLKQPVRVLPVMK